VPPSHEDRRNENNCRITDLTIAEWPAEGLSRGCVDSALPAPPPVACACKTAAAIRQSTPDPVTQLDSGSFGVLPDFDGSLPWVPN